MAKIKAHSLTGRITQILMYRAFRNVKRNRGAAGIDKVSITMFEANLEQNLLALMRALKTGTFQPLPLRRVHIPKGPGQTRPLGIPMIRAYCTPYQKPWGSKLDGCLLPTTVAVCLPWLPPTSIPRNDYFDDWFCQRRRVGFRKRVMTSGVNRIHHGPCAVLWMPSRRPDLHQAAMVDTSTFRTWAAAWAEQRPSPRSACEHAAGPSGHLLGMPWI